MIRFDELCEGLLVGCVPGVFASRYPCEIGTILAIAGAVASVASTGVGIAQSAGAFEKEVEIPPVTPEKSAEQQRAERMRRARLGRKQTWLTSGRELGTASVYTPTLKARLGE